MNNFILKILILVFLGMFAVATPALAQTGDPAVTNAPPAQPPVKHISGSDRIFSDIEIQLTYGVLVFGTFIIILQFVLMLRAKFNSETMIKMSTVTLVIVSTLFVITAGFDSRQIAPAMGLFGTIVGYVLGRETQKKE